MSFAWTRMEGALISYGLIVLTIVIFAGFMYITEYFQADKE